MNKKTIRGECVRQYKGKLLAYNFILMIYLVISFGLPLTLSHYINESIVYGKIINRQLFFLIALSGVELLFSSLKEECNIRLSNKIAFDLEYRLSNHMKFVEYEQIKKYDDAYLAQRLNNDAVLVGDFLCEKFPYFIVDVVFISLILFYFFCIDRKIMCLSIIGIILYGIVYVIRHKYVSRFAMRMLEMQALFFSMLSDQFNSILLIKINSWYEEKNKEFRNCVKKFYNTSLLYLRIEYLIKNGFFFVGRILMITAVCQIGLQISNRASVTAMMVGLIMYTEILIVKLNALNSFGDFYQKYKVACTRLDELEKFDLDKEGEKEISCIHCVELKSVVYTSGKIKCIYPDVKFEKGKIYVLKGKNGSGKSTLIKLLLGISHADQGEITYNGINIESINKKLLNRNKISVKNQVPYMIEGSLKRNIFPCDEGETPISVEWNVEKLLEFSKERGGMNMQIKGKNSTLSGGEQQCIAISRALCKNADFLILDEPASGLDGVTKNKLLKILRQMKNKIMLIITHENIFDEIADLILEIEK